MKLGKSLFFLAIAASFAPTIASAAADNNAVAAQALNQMPAHAQALRMSARDAFVVKDVILDTNGASHVRMDRLYAGLPVIGGDLVMHMSASGAFTNASTTMTSSLSLATKPKASSGSAIRAANAAFAGITSGQPSSTLSVYTRNGVTALAYDVLVRGTAISGQPSETHVIVDANTLAVLDKFDDIKTTAAAGTGNSLTSGVVPLTTDQTGATTFVLRDPTRGNHYINDLAGRRSGNGTTYTDSDNLWGNSSTSNSQTAAVDAMYGQNTTWDFYQSLGRNGINGTGSAGYSRVHYSRNYVNAYWSDSCFCMTYGDGDGATYLPLVALDVAGHEMTHGVTSTSAGLVYSGQSGGLNESMSDIMGTMVEFRGAKGNNLPNYLIGERIYTANNNVPTPTTALRYMFKPSLDGASPDCYTSTIGNLDVHYSSGVSNHFFYLLSEGAVSPSGFSLSPTSLVCNGNTALTAIGRDAASRILYRALTVYWTSSTNYSQARAGTLSAAADLYGTSSTQYNAVAAAWSAVSVN